ncbi:hypothetical protein ACQZV8_11270, partial [Magnetococcales bacterium HHB-1]
RCSNKAGGLGSVNTPEELRLRMDNRGLSIPVLLPFGPSLSAPLACHSSRCLKQFTCVNHTTRA